jgi:predicted enzyme related to lactoylglutathione lyase
MPAPRGTFIWYDVMTHDTKIAAAFYSDVIGLRRNIRCLTTASTRSLARGRRWLRG